MSRGFNHQLRMLSFVPRWQIAPRFRTQNVAEHSFFVALYTQQLCAYKHLWGADMQLLAIECALSHDAVEARTGDMPGPVKRAVVDRAKLKAYEAEQSEIMGLEIVEYPDEVLALVKVADLIDELFHVAQEMSMGNALITPQFEVTLERFNNAVIAAHLPWEVAALVEEEVATMRQGIRLPKNTAATDPLTPAAGGNVDAGYEIPF